jgi:hypothetical protein
MAKNTDNFSDQFTSGSKQTFIRSHILKNTSSFKS